MNTRKGMFLGMCQFSECRVSGKAPNNSVCITGLSGSGKTSRMHVMELDAVKNGNTVLIIDIGQTHSQERIFKKIREEYLEYANYIYAVCDGLGLDLLRPMKNISGGEELSVNHINSVVQSFSSSCEMGVQQQAILREAVIDAMDFQSKNPQMSESEALIAAFMRKRSVRWDGVYQKLWTVLNCNALRPSVCKIMSQRINIISFSELDMLSGEILAEVVLSWVWRVIYNNILPRGYGELVIVLDEFQHISMKKDAVLRTFLREGRKFNVSLILGTQTLSVFSSEVVSVLSQVATRLYFRATPEEVGKIARRIGASEIAFWKDKLVTLQVGECIALGMFEVANVESERPLILR